MKTTHPILRKQLEKFYLDYSKKLEDGQELETFLRSVNSFYFEQENTKLRLSNALRTSSQEMDRLYSELEEKTHRLVLESKMLALGEMSAGVAHEINNPLMVIQTSVEMLLLLMEHGKLDNETMKNTLDSIMKNSSRIANIVKSLRTFSRDGEKDPLEEYPLQSLVEDTLALCDQKLKSENVKVELNLNPEIRLKCRASQIEQVLLNLIINAKDAISEKEEKWIKISTETKDNQLILSVKDSGDGLKEEHIEKVFNPFFTTKPVGKGTGLGLSISKEIVEDHGWKLEYEKKDHSSFNLVINNFVSVIK